MITLRPFSKCGAVWATQNSERGDELGRQDLVLPRRQAFPEVGSDGAGERVVLALVVIDEGPEAVDHSSDGGEVWPSPRLLPFSK